MAKKSFYEIGSSEGYLREGFYLEVRRQINYRGDRADFKPFLNVPVKDLEKQLKESQAEEKKVFEEMKKAVTAWDEHGAQTLLLQKAIEYLKTPEVTHTRNEWQRHKDGSWEISNLVYKMTFNIVKSGDEWKLTWELSYTAPGLNELSTRAARSTRPWRGPRSTSRANSTSMRRALNPCPRPSRRRQRNCFVSTANSCKGIRSNPRSRRRKRSRWRTC